jgi:hypothetical protein
MRNRYRLSIVLGLIAAFPFAAQASAQGLKPKAPVIKPAHTVLTHRDDARHIMVKFQDALSVGIGAERVPFDRAGKSAALRVTGSPLAQFRAAGGTFERASLLSEATLDRMRATAQNNLGSEMPNLNNYFLLTVPPGVDASDWIDRLNALPEVELALPLPKPVRPPAPPNYRPAQGYLNVNPVGICAETTWVLPGGTGIYEQVADIEYGWNLSHNDLGSTITIDPPQGYVGYSPYGDDHGTAVLGELVSKNDNIGTVGACYGLAHVFCVPTYLASSVPDTTYRLDLAIQKAESLMVAGDVILIEQQIGGPNNTATNGDTGLVAVEWYKPYYDVIKTAVANGFVVVEAAGNGYQNLDDAVYTTGNGGHYPFKAGNSSGALIVGAGAAPNTFGGTDVARSRLAFSNYGSRLDLQGWGEVARSTGYGDVYNTDGKNYYYTDFSGTSSASPIVTAAAALLESVNFANLGVFLTPAQVRTKLVSTGSPQQAGTYPVAQKIGPLPNLCDALASVTPVEVSLVDAEAQPNQVNITWEVPEHSGLVVTIVRRTTPTGWSPIGTATVDGTGKISYVDGTVCGGTSYGYGFTLQAQQSGQPLGQTWIAVPVATQLTLEGARPNPIMDGRFSVAFTLPNSSPAQLELFDLSGRRVASRDLRDLGAGSHVVPFAEGARLTPGLYVVRLTQSGVSLIRKAAVVR